MPHRRLLAIAALAVLGAATACIPPPADPDPDPEPDPAWTAPKCWESSVPQTAGLYYTGPENTLNNAMYASRGNNCATLHTDFPMTVVRAADQSAANALCQTLKGTNASNLAEDGRVDPPADAYRCF